MKKRKKENSTSNVEEMVDVEHCDVGIDVYNSSTMEGNQSVKDTNKSPPAVIAECWNSLNNFMDDNHDGHSPKPKKPSNVHAYYRKQYKMWELRLIYHTGKGVKGKLKTVTGYPSQESALADSARFRTFYENHQVRGVYFVKNIGIDSSSSVPKAIPTISLHTTENLKGNYGFIVKFKIICAV